MGGGPGHSPQADPYAQQADPGRHYLTQAQDPPAYGQPGAGRPAPQGQEYPAAHGQPGYPAQGYPAPQGYTAQQEFPVQREYPVQQDHSPQHRAEPVREPWSPRGADEQDTGRPARRRTPTAAAPAGGAHNPLVRPYAMTGGRTRPRYQLAIEALISTTADPARLQGQLPEHQRICHLCQEIKSVAEISALLSIPLGVARILVADLAEAGLVAIHQPGGDESAGGQPDVTLLERVLSGLRKL
ncbi:DUF742 domain-containing protein [Streptomyces sp. NPDC059740]|uniref:DUF742 domain-containing protein n=1 Tax=Streptomyces sp. NPDC059740 TaxID=3346926 RepID=UPI00365C4DCF